MRDGSNFFGARAGLLSGSAVLMLRVGIIRVDRREIFIGDGWFALFLKEETKMF